MAEGRNGKRRKSGRKAAQADAANASDDDGPAPAGLDTNVPNGAQPAHAPRPPGTVQQTDQTDAPAAADKRTAKKPHTAQPVAARWPLPTWLLQAVAMALIAWATTALTGACPITCNFDSLPFNNGQLSMCRARCFHGSCSISPRFSFGISAQGGLAWLLAAGAGTAAAMLPATQAAHMQTSSEWWRQHAARFLPAANGERSATKANR
jgi:hypothetical protein